MPSAVSPAGSKNGPRWTRIGTGRPFDLDVEAAAVDGELVRDDREADHLAELGASAARSSRARPTTPSTTTWPPSTGIAPRRALEADEHPAEPAVGDLLRRPLADPVELLVVLHEPRHRRLVQVRLGVGVLADDHVALLEPEDPLRLEAERRGVEVAPCSSSVSQTCSACGLGKWSS